MVASSCGSLVPARHKRATARKTILGVVACPTTGAQEAVARRIEEGPWKLRRPARAPRILAADTSLLGKVRLGIAAGDSAMSTGLRRKELCSINQQ
jgi:hypothetical protein